MTIITGMSQTVNAQKGHSWDVGVSAELGKDYFDRRYAPYYDQFPDMVRSFKSNYSWGAGIWVERHFTQSFSGLARLNYMQGDMRTETYGEPGRTGNKMFVKEKHNHIITDVGGRWYVNPNSAIRMFVDFKVGANAFVAIDLYEKNDGKYTIKDVYGYNRWQPLALAAIGVNWKRVSLCLEYNRDLKRAEKSDNETTILRQGLSIKTSFSIVRF